VWTNAKSGRGAQRIFFQKQFDWPTMDTDVALSLYSANYFAEITCPPRHVPKFNELVHGPNASEPPVNVAAVRVETFWTIWIQWSVAISEGFNSIFSSWRLREVKKCM
jgi:hypothetical protein